LARRPVAARRTGVAHHGAIPSVLATCRAIATRGGVRDADAARVVARRYAHVAVHHEFPKDKDRLAMPPLVSITIATILLLLFRVLLGDLAFSFLPGFIVGYSYYLSVHYIVHVYQPPKNFFKVLWINHGIHHYKNGDAVFGVSSPLWDYIYGTMRDRKKEAKAV
jgi:sterol desaturase/sphingolipid hydroxylase (fatty acid hydroxylase superfamily)